jgi:hypothetical protein
MGPPWPGRQVRAQFSVRSALLPMGHGLFRDFHHHKRFVLEARAEASNLFNLVNLDNPGTVLGSKTFGVLSTATGSGTSNMRQLPLGLRLTF